MYIRYVHLSYLGTHPRKHKFGQTLHDFCYYNSDNLASNFTTVNVNVVKEGDKVIKPI